MTVATVVLQWENCPASRSDMDPRCLPVEVTPQMNREFADCVEAALGRAGKKGLRVMPGNVFHQQFLPQGIRFIDVLADANMMGLFNDPSVLRSLEAAGIGSVVTLEGYTLESSPRTAGDVRVGGMAVVWAVGRESRRETRVSATVWSVSTKAKAGVLKQKALGSTGFLVPGFMWIPLLPIPYANNTESKACEAMGKALIEFLYSDAEPLK